MRRSIYHFTPGAVADLREIGRNTAREWGKRQARDYLDGLRQGFERIAKDHKTFVKRDELNGGTGLSLYHVEKHYMAFLPLTDDEVIIAAVVHHSRDIPHRMISSA